MAQKATTYVTTIHRHIGSGTAPIVKSFYNTASVSYAKGDFVTIDSNGRAVKITANDSASVDGIVYSDVDASALAADAVQIPVIVYGNVWVDGIFSTSGGSYGLAASIGSAGGVTGDGTVAATGQAVFFSSGLTNKKFISLSVQAVPTTGAAAQIKKMLCLFLGNGKFY